MTSPISRTIRERGIFPYKGRGQHFLVNGDIADRIVALADVTDRDVVVEIGPGTGMLTTRLSKRAKRVIAVESDKKLADMVRETIPSDNLEVVFGDALKYDYRKLGETIGGTFKVVANLPYNISTPIIFRLLDARQAISSIVLMLQREVALRLVALPGTKEYGALTVTASQVSDISIGFHVGRGNFHPRPGVDSAVVRFQIRDRLPVDSVDVEIFSRVVRASFMGRRKVLSNALKPLFLEDAAQKVDAVGALSGIDLRRRGETLSVEEFAVLARAVSNILEDT